ncbi:MAG: hypothetical protein K2X38_20320 [Gemmataceae bacterium]|nr:hypothetical protein [Gemmataceae bacterium]
MNPERIREMLRRQPFEPFEIRLSNGESHRVRHPELAWVTNNCVYINDPETDRVAILSLIRVNSLELYEAKS